MTKQIAEDYHDLEYNTFDTSGYLLEIENQTMKWCMT